LEPQENRLKPSSIKDDTLSEKNVCFFYYNLTIKRMISMASPALRAAVRSEVLFALSVVVISFPRFMFHYYRPNADEPQPNKKKA
jgi:hypothetical protein